MEVGTISPFFLIRSLSHAKLFHSIVSGDLNSESNYTPHFSVIISPIVLTKSTTKSTSPLCSLRFFIFLKHAEWFTTSQSAVDGAVNTGLVGLNFQTISTVNTKYRRSTFCLTTSLLRLFLFTYFIFIYLFMVVNVKSNNSMCVPLDETVTLTLTLTLTSWMQRKRE